jgi:hypothetical protein
MKKGVVLGLLANLIDSVDLSLLASNTVLINTASTEEADCRGFGVAAMAFHTVSGAMSLVGTEASSGIAVAKISCRACEQSPAFLRHRGDAS